MKMGHLSAHAQIRMRQRAISELDLHLAMLFGTQVRDGYIIRDKDVAYAIERINHLRGIGIFLEEDTVVSVQRLKPSKLKRKMRSR